jgi:flagellar biosynthesis protein FlhG
MQRTDTAESKPLLIAVGGGKGGVGKSVIALNLALAMAKLGARVTVVDADLGSANLHTMLGIDHPGRTLQAYLDNRVSSLSEVCIPSGFANLSLVPGSIAVPGAANLQHASKLKLLRQLHKLPADAVVIDCGAGVHYNVVDFFAAADSRLLVANAQLVSLQNAYGFLKACLYRMLRRHAQDAGKADMFDAASDHSEVETVQQLLAHVAAQDAELAEDLREFLENCRFALVGNQLVDSREQNALHGLARMIADFLNLRVPVLGGLLRKDRIHGSVTRRRPFVADGTDAESKLILQLAEAYLNLQPRAAGRAAATDGAVSGGRPNPLAGAAGIAAQPVPSLKQYERAHVRHEVDWPATVEISGVRQSARVVDISRGGVQLELARPSAVGAHVRIVLPNEAGLGLFSARVVYISGNSVGCVFDPEPSRSARDALLLRARQQPSARQAQAGDSNGDERKQ